MLKLYVEICIKQINMGQVTMWSLDICLGIYTYSCILIHMYIFIKTHFYIHFFSTS